MGAAHGHLANLTFAGLTINHKVSWGQKVTGRSPDVTSGEDTSGQTDQDNFHAAEGTFVALVPKDGDLIPVNTRGTARFYRYSASTADVSSSAITDVLTINGIDYTMAAETDVTANEWADVAGLVLAINSFTYGSRLNFIATAVADVVTVVGFGAILAMTKTELAGTIAIVDLAKWSESTISIDDVEEGPDMNSGDVQEVTYTYKSSGPIVDQDGNLR